MTDMAKKPRKKPYSIQQYKLLQKACEHQVEKLGSQTKVGLAMGVSQQSIANLLAGSYWPDVERATQLANLEGYHSLEELIGEYDRTVETPAPLKTAPIAAPMSNLEKCIAFDDGQRGWSTWTLAAARSGYFGTDTSPREWEARLDSLEETLQKERERATAKKK